jgi:pimeloyl-ACP methyl ester carboxylesterase
VKETVNQIHQIDSFPEIPVYVITGGKENRMIPEEVRKKRLDNQVELLSLSRNNKHIIAQKSGHFPQLSEPTVVIDSIKDCIKQINNKTDI